MSGSSRSTWGTLTGVVLILAGLVGKAQLQGRSVADGIVGGFVAIGIGVAIAGVALLWHRRRELQH